MLNNILSLFLPKRFRHTFMLLGSLLVIALLVLSDPDFGIISNLPIGASTLATLIILSKVVLYVSVLHLARKALHDYPEADAQSLFSKAKETSQGAGLALIAIALTVIAISITFISIVTH